MIHPRRDLLPSQLTGAMFQDLEPLTKQKAVFRQEYLQNGPLGNKKPYYTAVQYFKHEEHSSLQVEG